MIPTRRLIVLTVIVLGGGALALVLTQRYLAHQAAAVPAARPPAAALRVQIDPVTGQTIAAPANGGSVAAPAPKISRADLVEEPGETEAGGFTVHARGHFRSTLSAPAKTNSPAAAVGR